MSCVGMYEVHIVKGRYQIVVGDNESVWWSIIVETVDNDSTQESTRIVAAGNNSVPWVMMYAGAPC